MRRSMGLIQCKHSSYNVDAEFVQPMAKDRNYRTSCMQDMSIAWRRSKADRADRIVPIQCGGTHWD